MTQKFKNLFRRVVAIVVIFLIITLFYLLIRHLTGANYYISSFEFYAFGVMELLILCEVMMLLRYSNQQKLYSLAHDPITGILWRSQIPKTCPKMASAYAYVIIKGYDQYLERYGLSVGDPITKAVGEAFQKQLPHFGTMYRFSDTDLLIICESQKPFEDIISDLQEAIEKIAEELVEVPIEESIHIHFTLSIGIVSITYTTESEILSTYAKFAANEALRKEDPTVKAFDITSYSQYRSLLERRRHLSEVIDSAQIMTVFQPIISCKNGKLYGYEALTRPTNPAYASVTELLDDAEVLGIYPQLEMVMTLKAIQTFRDLDGHCRLFINMAPEAIRKKIYNDPIKQGLFDNIKFVIEIIERGEVLADIISLLNKSVVNLNALIALDDFGTGYSNHLALLNSKPDIVKVSRELIENIDTDLDKQQIYENIVSFARGMGTKVLAEGVETQTQFEYLLRFGMDLSQGYYIGKPNFELQAVPTNITQLVEKYRDFSELLEQQQISRFSR